MEHTNDLINASSPYLLQHAHNPVNWHAWEDKILQQAKTENKLLLISIGYSACHWCHVMEHESFSDEEVAEFMNAHFICIKIDREERPDIDQIYMNASLLINGSGGWPLNAFALPDGRPFYVLTYQPKSQWLSLLRQIVQLYKTRRPEVEEQASALTEGIRRKPLIERTSDYNKEQLKTMYSSLWDKMKSSIDGQRGGLGHAPKFPMPSVWDFLLQYAYLTGTKEALDATTTTLDKMAGGGIYDQIGGGFARYSVDARWHVPHFEKMLYDNAQLVSLYAHAFQCTHKEYYENVIRETLDFIQREMTGREGGFYSALNADSEGEEGKFYVWNVMEVESILPSQEAEIFMDYFQMKPEGNWEEGKNILHACPSDEDFAKKKGIEINRLHEILRDAKHTLLKARNRRIRPSTDDKMLTSWNALMIKAYIDAYSALGDDKYLDTAITQMNFILQNMTENTYKLYRCYKDGKASVDGMLEDYAFLAEALIHLYRVTFEFHWLEQAKGLADHVHQHFKDEATGLYYFTSDLSEGLIARKIEVEDNVIPSSNAVMAQVLYFLGRYYEDRVLQERSREMMQYVVNSIPASAAYFSCWAKLLGWMQAEEVEVVITGKKFASLNKFLQQHFLPNVLFLGGKTDHLPLLKDKIKEDPVMYVCKNKTCMPPTSDRYAVLDNCLLSFHSCVKKF